MTDPQGDESPGNAGIDLVSGDLAYDEAGDSFRFTIGVTRLADAPMRVSYGFAFDYDGARYGVSVVRWDDGSSTVTAVSTECAACSVVYDTRASVVHLIVPRKILDERIASASAHTYSAGSPTGRAPSPPLRRGATIARPGLHAAVGRQGPLQGTDPTLPSDVAASDRVWTMP